MEQRSITCHYLTSLFNNNKIFKVFVPDMHYKLSLIFVFKKRGPKLSFSLARKYQTRLILPRHERQIKKI